MQHFRLFLKTGKVGNRPIHLVLRRMPCHIRSDMMICMTRSRSRPAQTHENGGGNLQHDTFFIFLFFRYIDYLVARSLTWLFSLTLDSLFLQSKHQ